MKTLSEKIVDVIIYDLSDRSGLGNEWENIDRDVAKGIKLYWIDIVNKELEKANKGQQ
jgi:hypothetical protein